MVNILQQIDSLKNIEIQKNKQIIAYRNLVYKMIGLIKQFPPMIQAAVSSSPNGNCEEVVQQTVDNLLSDIERQLNDLNQYSNDQGNNLGVDTATLVDFNKSFNPPIDRNGLAIARDTNYDKLHPVIRRHITGGTKKRRKSRHRS